MCGHDTIALATTLAQTGRLPASGAVRLATDVGILSVSVASDGLVTMNQAVPVYGSCVDPEAAANALGLSLPEIADTGLPVQIVSTGTPFLIVPVQHRAALNALAPDMAALIAYGDSLMDFIAGVYVWSPETVSADAQIHARALLPGPGPAGRPGNGDSHRRGWGVSGAARPKHPQCGRRSALSHRAGLRSGAPRHGEGAPAIVREGRDAGGD